MGPPPCRPVHNLVWRVTFHPTREEHLVKEVMEYWRSQGIRTSVRATPTSRRVDLSSVLVSAWWLHAIRRVIPTRRDFCFAF